MAECAALIGKVIFVRDGTFGPICKIALKESKSFFSHTQIT